MNWIRILTGSAVAFSTALFVFIGGLVFSLSVSVVAVLALWEFYKLTIHNFISFKNLLFVVLSLINSIVLILTTHIYGISPLILIVSFGVISAALLSVIVFETTNKNYPYIIMRQVFGLVYVAVPLSFLVAIRNYDHGLFWSIMILCSIAAGDIGAYYVGSFLGQHKLCPNISPNKTLEGSMGGLLSTIIVILTFKIYLFDFVSILGCIIFACALGIIGQVGDLFASEFKRVAGVKDSGSFLPGHGGFLDRIDSILLAMPVAYLFRFYIFL